MNHVIIQAHVFTGEQEYEDGFIRFNKKILAVGPMSEYNRKASDQVVHDAKGSLVVPGFIDVHSHGGYGIDCMDGDSYKINEMTQKMLSEGITSYFPTTMTQSDARIEQALIGIRKAKETNPMIQGIHLEGPFVSVDFKGAQPEEYIRVADVEMMARWNALSGGNIQLVTYAPEIGQTSDFEAYCLENNIVLSAGHSGATYQELLRSKASHVTHLFNGQRGLHHREIGVAGYGLIKEEVYAEIIVDGLHVSPEMVKLAYKTKGASHLLLITDSMRAKGLPNGESELGGQKVFVKDNEARLENGALAGSVLKFNEAFKNTIEFTGCSIADAVQMSSVNQAREFDLVNKGLLSEGKDADFVIMDEEFEVLKTVLGGQMHGFRE